MITISKNKLFKIKMGSNNDRITLRKKYKNQIRKEKHILNLLKLTIIACMHIIRHCLKTKTEQTMSGQY